AGLRIESSGGDGIYLGRGKNRITNKDIILRDLIIFEHLRQGISVITAENLLVEKCVIRGTRGTAPEAGIDFEPNREDESIINCNVKNCIIAGNSGAGIQGYFVNMGSTSLPISIIIENCDIYDQLVALFFVGFQNGAHGTLRIIDSDVRGLSLIPDIPELTLSYR
ncbi:MAG: right-handed parallel beta-helix repeat-containing protein, partial [Spirochaetaceae bacterium]